MKNKNLLPALTLLAIVWIVGFVVFKVLHLIGISWWWILLPIPVGVVLVIVFQVTKGFIRGGGTIKELILRSRKIGKRTAFFAILAFIITLVLIIYISALHSDTGYEWLDVVKKQLRPAVELYQRAHNDTVPLINDTVISVSGGNVVPGKDYYVLAICPLLDEGLWDIPPTTHPRNCLPEGANVEPGTTACLNQCNGSYIWLTTINGVRDSDVVTICVGDKCKAHGEDGYQGVYP